MSLLAGTRRALLGRPQTYAEKVLSYDGLIAYWPLWEAAGATARCLVNPAQNGTYVGVTLGQTVTDANGVSFVCPFFDGLTDYVDVQTAAFQTAINGAAGTAMIWARVNGVAVWTDGATRQTIRMVDTDDFNEAIQLYKRNVNNSFASSYTAGGAVNQRLFAASSVNWMHHVITWDKVADEVKVYYDGIQQGATLNGLGVWAGTVDIATIGAANVVPTQVWHGWISNLAIFDRALPQPAITDLATV